MERPVPACQRSCHAIRRLTMHPGFYWRAIMSHFVTSPNTNTPGAMRVINQTFRTICHCVLTPLTPMDIERCACFFFASPPPPFPCLTGRMCSSQGPTVLRNWWNLRENYSLRSYIRVDRCKWRAPRMIEWLIRVSNNVTRADDRKRRLRSVLSLLFPTLSGTTVLKLFRIVRTDWVTVKMYRYGRWQ